MGTPKGLKVDDVIAALQQNRGNVAAAARDLGVARNAVQWYIDTRATVRDAYDEALETINDRAEGHLVDKVEAGELPAIIYWLNNKGRKRGYGQQRTDPALNVTPDDLAKMTDEELDALAARLDKLAHRR